MTLIERMIEYRAKHNLSQSELADKCNLSTMTVNAIERGYQNPSKITLAKIELILKDEVIR